MQFLGGLGYGGGAIINGALLEDLGKKGEKITSGFKLAVDSIVRGKKYLAEHRKRLPPEFRKCCTGRWPPI